LKKNDDCDAFYFFQRDEDERKSNDDVVDDEKSGNEKSEKEQFSIGEEKLGRNELVNSLFEKASKKVFDSSETLSSNEMRAMLIKLGFLSDAE
jgi:hypothetical protein